MPFRNRARERPMKQERETAKDIGGRRVPASGSMRFNPGDATNEAILVDAKTTSRSYNLNIHTLKKLHLEATSKGKEPVIQVEFTDMPVGRQKYAVIDWERYLELLEGK